MSTTPRRSARRTRSPAAVLARRAAVVMVVVGLVAFAVEGGEYSTRDLITRNTRRAQLELEVERLKKVVDSLTIEQELVANDAATLERIAREEYGMVRGDRELLYRIVDEVDETQRDSLTE